MQRKPGTIILLNGVGSADQYRHALQAIFDAPLAPDGH